MALPPGFTQQTMDLFNACVSSVSVGDLARGGEILKAILHSTSARPAQLHLLQAHYRIATNEPKLALKFIEEGARKGLGEDSVQLYRAKAYVLMGRYADAETAFRRAAKVLAGPGNLKQQLNVVGELGSLCLRQGQIDKAHICFADAITYAKGILPPPVAQPSVPPAPLAAAPNPILYLPLEVKNREFDAKLLVALFAAVGGLDVVIGQKWLIQQAWGNCAPGLVMFKTMNGYDRHHVKRARAAGHATVGLDEEAFGRVWSRANTFDYIHPDCINDLDLVCAQNAEQVTVLESALGVTLEKARVTGNPRSDLYRLELAGLFADAHAALRAEYGARVILINGMSGNINPGSRTFNLVLEDLSRLTAPEHAPVALDHQRKIVDYEIAVLNQYPAVIRAVAEAFPSHTVVFRPHPVEDIRFWQNALGTLPNLRIAGTGSIRSWLGAVDAMVFVAGCTTGLEAVLAGVPAVRFIPGGGVDLIEGAVSNTLGVGAGTPDAVTAALQAVLQAAPSPDSAAAARIEVCLGDWTGVYTSQQTVKACMEKFAFAKPSPEMKATTVAALAAAQSLDFRRASYYGTKFPGIAIDEVNGQLARLAAAVGLTAEGLTVSAPNDSVFYIEARR